MASALVTPYGDSDQQFVRVYPDEALVGKASPVVVVLHGGFWKNKYNVDNAALDKFPAALKARGFITMEVEYRRRDHPGGGWPGTNDDAAAALRALPKAVSAAGLIPDLKRVIVMGHSAGGTLALWSADAMAKETGAEVVPALAIAIAPITDLEAGYTSKLSDEGDAVELYMKGTPATAADAYNAASPIKLLPLKTNTVVVSGAKDVDVPTGHIAPYAAAATEQNGGNFFTHVDIPTADHFDLVNVDGETWKVMMDA